MLLVMRETLPVLRSFSFVLDDLVLFNVLTIVLNICVVVLITHE